MKILVLGQARHGKDTIAKREADRLGLRYEPTSLILAKRVIHARMMGYASAEECYADRHAHRKEWEWHLKDYNRYNPTRFASKVLADCDFYVGMRGERDVEACLKAKMVDVVWWVDASQRVGGEDETLEVTKDQVATWCYHHGIKMTHWDNN